MYVLSLYKLLLNAGLDTDIFTAVFLQVSSCIQQSNTIERQDRRVTGSNLIDEQLHGVVTLVVRDFVFTWYNQLTHHQAFITHLHRTVQHAMVVFSNRYLIIM